MSPTLNLGNMLGGAMPNIRPATAQPTQTPFKSHLKVADGDAAYDTIAEVLALLGAAGAGYRKVWEKTVPAQQAMRWGFGSPAFPYNQGYMWFVLLDAGTGFTTGKVRLNQSNARETKVFTVAEMDMDRLHTTTNTTLVTATPTDINTMLALPEKAEFPLVGEDSRLAIWVSCVTRPAAEDVGDFSIPVTIYQ